ncbi:MAG: alpha/beta hydrolase [Flavobacteriaceae bacterium]|nr:alpha/beta hydrolase [Flavobacteriaceae bacterium]
MKLLKKILKITGIVVVLLLVGLYGLFVNFSSTKSDTEVLEDFEDAMVQPVISHETFNGYSYRKLSIVKDTTLTTLVFIHGTIGSCLDFKRYMSDSLLLSKVNMISYDRIGYNFEEKNPVQESIAFEAALLQDLTKQLKMEKTILVGYSYGGPIALAAKDNYQKIILLAPAVYSKIEPMPWMLNFYKWKLTRWLVPSIWKEASKEKMSHQQDLRKFENNWKQNTTAIVSIHGDSDGIVPYKNSLFLEKQFPKEQFTLVTLKEAGHGLVWSRFEEIKSEIINQLH